MQRGYHMPPEQEAPLGRAPHDASGSTPLPLMLAAQDRTRVRAAAPSFARLEAFVTEWTAKQIEARGDLEPGEAGLDAFQDEFVKRLGDERVRALRDNTAFVEVGYIDVARWVLRARAAFDKFVRTGRTILYRGIPKISAGQPGLVADIAAELDGLAVKDMEFETPEQRAALKWLQGLPGDAQARLDELERVLGGRGGADVGGWYARWIAQQLRRWTARELKYGKQLKLWSDEVWKSASKNVRNWLDK